MSNPSRWSSGGESCEKALFLVTVTQIYTCNISCTHAHIRRNTNTYKNRHLWGLPWIPTGFYYYGSKYKKEKRQSTRPHCSFSWLTSATYNIQEQILYCKDSLSDLLFTYCFPSLIASSKQNPLHLSNDGEDVWGERQLKCSKLMFFFHNKSKSNETFPLTRTPPSEYRCQIASDTSPCSSSPEQGFVNNPRPVVKTKLHAHILNSSREYHGRLKLSSAIYAGQGKWQDPRPGESKRCAVFPSLFSVPH